MKTALAVFLLSTWSLLVLAAGDHGGHHGMHGHSTKRGHDMAGMPPGAHATTAGKPGDPARVSRTIEVTMDDTMRFVPDRIQVKAGETVRFFVRNRGKLQHEFVLGTRSELEQHAAMMRQMPHMTHSEPNMVSLPGGKLGGLVWQFDKPGSVDFACLVPGHFEAGMVGRIIVE